jgi:hypothetical protein
LSCGFSLQSDADARMPLEKLGGTVRIILEQEVFHRMPLVPRGAGESRLNPSAHPCLMPFAARVPVVFGQDLHDLETYTLAAMRGRQD